MKFLDRKNKKLIYFLLQAIKDCIEDKFLDYHSHQSSSFGVYKINYKHLPSSPIGIHTKHQAKMKYTKPK